MKLNAVKIKNFRAIANCKINFDQDITIIVGDNATGKTAILEAIRLCLVPVNEMIKEEKRSVKPERLDLYDVRQRTPLGEPEVLWQDWPVSILACALSGSEPTAWKIQYNIFEDRPMMHIGGRISSRDSFRNIGKIHPGVVFAYYGVSRSSYVESNKRKSSRDFFSHFGHNRKIMIEAAREGALDAKAIFSDAGGWFEAIESLELRRKRDSDNSGWHDPVLSAVRNSVEQMMENVSNLRVTGLPPRLTVDFLEPNGRKEPLLIDQLSGGYRSLLAMVIDLSRRLAMLNPEMENPLLAPGIVLIDEIDLHLHPKWQQTVLWKLKSIFKNIQFIVTTHSELVLSGFHPRNIRKIVWKGDELTFDPDLTSTYGAESGRLQEEVMGVKQRPPESMSEFTRLLAEYREMLYANRWQTAEADEVWQRLHMLNPDDPVLRTLELERRRRSVKR